MDTTRALLTLAQAAGSIGIDSRALGRLIKLGRGPRAVTLGKRLRVRPSDLESWVAGLEPANPDPEEPTSASASTHQISPGREKARASA